MEFKSIDELKKAMERACQETNGNVQLKDLFNDKFMRQFTKCSNFEDFCENKQPHPGGGDHVDAKGQK